jgi:acetyl esterase/lipase
LYDRSDAGALELCAGSDYGWKFMRVLTLLALLLMAAAFAEDAPEWPERNVEALPPASQPAEGPGGAEYVHATVVVTERGEGSGRYWIFTPAEPALESAPVVAFIHGFGALTPDSYVEWLRHICRRGNIVIYPQYQEHALEPPANYAPNSAQAVREALQFLEEDEDRVQPLREKFALVGHSAGGVTAANMAADWEELKLPQPRAVMPVQPGRAFSFNAQAQANGLIPLSKFENIPAGCLLLSVFSDSDHTVGAWCARTIFLQATSVKPENKNLVMLRSCDYGRAPAVATHTTAAAPEGGASFWDWYGYWKLFDGLSDAAFHGRNREYALGDTPQQRHMGKYSDGRPFTELKVWLGDAEVDSDEGYVPAFNRTGTRRTERE